MQKTLMTDLSDTVPIEKERRMLIICLIISILTGLISAGLAYAGGAGIVVVLLTYSFSGGAALVLSMTIVGAVYPGWRALS